MSEWDEKTPVVVYHDLSVGGQGTEPQRTVPTYAGGRTLFPLGKASGTYATPSKAPSVPPRAEARRPGNGHPEQAPSPAELRHLAILRRLSPENRFLLESIALAFLEQASPPDR